MATRISPPPPCEANLKSASDANVFMTVSGGTLVKAQFRTATPVANGDIRWYLAAVSELATYF